MKIVVDMSQTCFIRASDHMPPVTLSIRPDLILPFEASKDDSLNMWAGLIETN
jgi:hypothetical protein